MNYNYDYLNFLRPLMPGIRNLQILDSEGVIKYTINPFFIINTIVSNNLVKINLKNDKLIILDFQNSIESKSAIEQLQGQIDELTNNTPIVIDKNIANYLEHKNTFSPSGGSLFINGHLSPGTSSLYNLGSPEYEWHTLYVGSQSLVVGGVTVSSSNGSIAIQSINLGTTEAPVILTATGSELFLNGSIFQETSEVINTNNASASIMTYDFLLGSIWYHATASNNFTADFINLPTTNNRFITSTIIISQGATAYAPDVVQISGVTQSVKWSSGTYSASTNGIDVIEFSFIRSNNSWVQILGQINPFS